VEILLARQVALQIVGNRVERVFHISTGSGGATPSGSFRVYRKERMSWSVPFSTWMPWASYFVGGIALHAYPSVPAYPASHGCIRMMTRDAPLLYSFATHGTPVDVVWEIA
jgi:lipoprotein-anchoring transpeptidase ErfK/SrfK